MARAPLPSISRTGLLTSAEAVALLPHGFSVRKLRWLVEQGIVRKVSIPTHAGKASGRGTFCYYDEEDIVAFAANHLSNDELGAAEIVNRMQRDLSRLGSIAPPRDVSEERQRLALVDALNLVSKRAMARRHSHARAIGE